MRYDQAEMPPTHPSSGAPPSASRLSHLSTTTLSSVLELTRLHQLDVAAPAHLTQSIQKNLTLLARGITAIEEAGSESQEVVNGLRGQWERIAGLVEPLGVVIEERLRPAPGPERTGRLVETDDEEHDDETAVDGDEGCVCNQPPRRACMLTSLICSAGCNYKTLARRPRFRTSRSLCTTTREI